MDIKSKSAEVMKAVYDHEYYVERFNNVLKRRGMSVASIDQQEHSEQDLVNMWNDFWFVLPDSPSIRRYPFGSICDLAEHIFDEPDDTDPDA